MKLGPCLPGVVLGQADRGRGKAARDVCAQKFPHLRVGEAPIRAFLQHAQAHQCSHEPAKQSRIGLHVGGHV